MDLLASQAPYSPESFNIRSGSPTIGPSAGVLDMAVTMMYLGHSGFIFEGDGHSVAIDPYLTGNPVASMAPADVKVQHIALSHGHQDHLGDTVAIARKNKAKVYAPWETHQYLSEQGVKLDETTAGNPGGKISTVFGYVAFTQAWHSSSYKGKYMGVPCGVILHIAGVTIYHCGDTALFSDMKMIGDLYKPDVACIPIGDRFTMGPEHATLAAEWIGAKTAVPIHYKTWPILVQDASRFTPRGVTVREMAVGEVLKVDPAVQVV